jgi:uncharacterized protein (DUF302 family)
MQNTVSKIIITLCLISVLNANADLVNFNRTHSVKDTLNKFEMIVKSKGMNIFAKIDHAKGAHSINKDLRPTQVLIFGSPKAGTPLMQENQTIGLDLPLRVLFWQDKNSDTWITYHNPVAVISSHSITNKQKIVKKMTKILNAFSNKAAN